MFQLLEKGELKRFGAVDLRVPGASRAMIRVTRNSVVDFLTRRSDTGAIADANPQPKPRKPFGSFRRNTKNRTPRKGRRK